MILYVNGDSHSAGAEAVNQFAFAEDDPHLKFMGRAPHPDNAQVCWAQVLADHLNYDLFLDAESAASNTRILRTSRTWIESNPGLLDQTLIIIQWSTWERQEWLHNGQYYQVNASGIDTVPQELQQQYKQYIADVDWNRVTAQAHEEIYSFHQELVAKNVKHVFFNGNTSFARLATKYQWHGHYMNPYDDKLTYDTVLRSTGFLPTVLNGYHFGRNAHCFWAEIMLHYISKNKMVGNYELCTN